MSGRVAGRIIRGPEEGWISLGLVVLMSLTVAWSIDDARWVLGRDAFTDFLALAAIGGVLVAFVGVKVGWGRWLTHTAGAIVAALVVPLLVGGVLEPESPLVDRHTVTALAVGNAWIDLAVLNRSVTQQYGHFLLVLGLFVWATAMFASYATFGHRRPLNAALIVGAVLIGSMAITINDQLVYLVLFSLATLFLLARFRVFDEKAEWLRRRIGDPSSISALYLRGGTVFIVTAVVGSLLLTQAASSAPLAGAWRGLGDGIIEASRNLQRYLPTGGSNRPVGVSFGSTAQISGIWTFDGSLAVTIEHAPTETRDFYWRAVVYDRFELTAWSRSPALELTRDAREDLLEGTADAVDATGRRPVTFTVIPEAFRGSTILAPATAATVSEEVKVFVVGEDGWFAAIDRAAGRGPYAVTALVPVYGDAEPGGLTQNRLRAAGTDYPADIEALYLEVPPGAIPPGGDAERLLAEVLGQAAGSTPYDIAVAMERELRSPRSRYATDVRYLPCEGLSTVECFARFREGYCQYFATTMAVLLRQAGIPTRVVEGFLPGDRDPATGLERVYMSAAHQWVEVYFPGFGWVEFDPTGGGLARTEPLPSGRPEVDPAPEPTDPGEATRPPERPDPFGEGLVDDEIPGAGAMTGGSSGPLIAVALVLFALVGALAAIAWARGPRGTVTPDGAYGMVIRFATRLGFGPRSTQTVYEYAGALGEVVPAARPDLHTVAHAKVEVSYGRRTLGADSLRSIREAQRRLRISLLRLLFVPGARRRR